MYGYNKDVNVHNDHYDKLVLLGKLVFYIN